MTVSIQSQPCFQMKLHKHRFAAILALGVQVEVFVAVVVATAPRAFEFNLRSVINGESEVSWHKIL